MASINNIVNSVKQKLITEKITFWKMRFWKGNEESAENLPNLLITHNYMMALWHDFK